MKKRGAGEDLPRLSCTPEPRCEAEAETPSRETSRGRAEVLVPADPAPAPHPEPRSRGRRRWKRDTPPRRNPRRGRTGTVPRGHETRPTVPGAEPLVGGPAGTRQTRTPSGRPVGLAAMPWRTAPATRDGPPRSRRGRAGCSPPSAPLASGSTPEGSKGRRGASRNGGARRPSRPLRLRYHRSS